MISLRLILIGFLQFFLNYSSFEPIILHNNATTKTALMRVPSRFGRILELNYFFKPNKPIFF